MSSKWLIVGAGFTGATLAERIATQLGEHVTVIDRRPHIAGNAYDELDDAGVLVHRYGPHIFHTNSGRVWQYLSQFTEWRPYYHRVRASVDGQFVPLPFNYNSLRALLPDFLANTIMNHLVTEFGFGGKVTILELRASLNKDLRFIADFVYEKVFLNYTKKQWGLLPDELDPSVTARVPILVSRDDRYFQDRYQAMPLHGYSDMFQRMLTHPKISVRLNTNWSEARFDAGFDKIVFTGQIDEFFDFAHGELPYRSLDFKFVRHVGARAQDVGTVNYPNDFDFTRVTEQNYLTGQADLPTSTLIYEYPQPWRRGVNDPYYPIPRPGSRELLAPYAKLAKELAGKVFFAGRLADYQYYNMDQAVGRALSLFSKEIAP
jgi:UDP-galactopyranose mutase